MPLSSANGSAALVVLLVEDEVVLRWSIAEALRNAGYTVVETASGEEAIALCKSHVSIDVIVTDINLAGQSAAGTWLTISERIGQRSRCSIRQENRLILHAQFPEVRLLPSRTGTTTSLVHVGGYAKNDRSGQTATWQQVRATSALPPQSRHALTRLARQFRATFRH